MRYALSIVWFFSIPADTAECVPRETRLALDALMGEQRAERNAALGEMLENEPLLDHLTDGNKSETEKFES